MFARASRCFCDAGEQQRLDLCLRVPRLRAGRGVEAGQHGLGHHLKAIGIILIVAVIVIAIAVVKAARRRRSGAGRAPSQ